MNDRQQNDFAKLTILDNQATPFRFVVKLLEVVFSKSHIDAQLIAATAHNHGEADCGVWPAAVADALLQAALARIDAAGHPLAFARTSADGRDVVGQETCSFCGKPSSQLKLLYRGEAGCICNDCILRGASHLSESVTGTSFSRAHEVLDWHFADIGQEKIETSIRSFPIRMRADFQLALDAIFPPKTTKYMGIKSAYAYQTVAFADLWETGRSAQSIVPVQYDEIDIGEETPRRCISNALWVLETEELKHAILVTQVQDHRSGDQIRLEIAAPQGELGVHIAAQYFRQIEIIIKQARSYRGKVLSLEVDDRWHGMAGAITVHRLPQVQREDVILPEDTLKLLDRNVIDFAANRPKLRAIGQPSKKGLLFYGPPGTGKTHTIQYLASCLENHTTLLVTAEQVASLHEYFGLARLLQPALLVIEDADLIARDREELGSAVQEALLNKLLNEMDGLRQDADIFFVLTTNRPEHLEAALAGRPGRIDQAIEFPLPDEVGRAKLIRLYAGNLSISGAILDTTVRRTEYVSPAFIKELMRRVAQYVFEREDAANEVTDEDVRGALDEMLFAGGRLNARLLGGPGNAE